MVTKEQLERLKKPVTKNAELHYTIGGSIETAVHSNIESERIAKYNKGRRIMKNVSADFRKNMALKPREGLARAQFKNAQTPLKEQRHSVDYTTPKATQSSNSASIKNERVNAFKQAVNNNQKIKTIER